ncbi:hypothetical protein DFJ74DRAFT_142786, partial [Hyaloraphidium curvatum]
FRPAPPPCSPAPPSPSSSPSSSSPPPPPPSRARRWSSAARARNAATTPCASSGTRGRRRTTSRASSTARSGGTASGSWRGASPTPGRAVARRNAARAFAMGRGRTASASRPRRHEEEIVRRRGRRISATISERSVFVEYHVGNTSEYWWLGRSVAEGDLPLRVRRAAGLRTSRSGRLVERAS